MTQRDLFGEPEPTAASSQWFTPRDLARRIAAWVPRDCGSILEPMAGDGELIAALGYHGHHPRKITACEIIPETAEVLRDRFPELGALHVGDAYKLEEAWRRHRRGWLFDVGIANPPYENGGHFDALALMLRLCRVAIVLAPLAMESTPQRCSWLLQNARMRRRAVVGWRVKFRGPHGYTGPGMIEVQVSEWTQRRPSDQRNELVLNERWLHGEPVAAWSGPLPALTPDGAEPAWSPIYQRSPDHGAR